MKKHNTENLKKLSKSVLGDSSRKDKMAKRLSMAKLQAKKKQEENKFKKSDKITLRASYLESKINSSVTMDSNPFDQIQEVNEDMKEN